MADHLFIKGPPRSGKTTLVEKLIIQFNEKLTGFLTKEVRNHNLRIGFDLIDITNNTKIQLARIGNNYPRVSKYEIYIDNLEQFLENCDFNSPVVIIDEIGKMECYSKKFINLIKKLYQDKIVIATIPVYTLPIIKSIIDEFSVEIYNLNQVNRDQILRKALNWLNYHKNKRLS